MNIEKLLLEFEQKLILQRYSLNSIRNYKSAVKSFLETAEKKFSHPNFGCYIKIFFFIPKYNKGFRDFHL